MRIVSAGEYFWKSLTPDERLKAEQSARRFAKLMEEARPLIEKGMEEMREELREAGFTSAANETDFLDFMELTAATIGVDPGPHTAKTLRVAALAWIDRKKIEANISRSSQAPQPDSTTPAQVAVIERALLTMIGKTEGAVTLETKPTKKPAKKEKRKPGRPSMRTPQGDRLFTAFKKSKPSIGLKAFIKQTTGMSGDELTKAYNAAKRTREDERKRHKFSAQTPSSSR